VATAVPLSSPSAARPLCRRVPQARLCRRAANLRSSGGICLEMAAVYDGHMARVGSWEVDTEGTGGTTVQMETDPGVAASRVAHSTDR
jgi:hypothetical protein